MVKQAMQKEKENNLKIIIERIHKLGMYPKELMEKTGATRSAVSQWMNYKNYPREKYIKKLSEVLNLYRASDGLLYEKDPSEQIVFTKIPLLEDNELISCDKNIVTLLKANFLLKNDFAKSRYCCAFRINNDFSCGIIKNKSIDKGDICIIDAEDRKLIPNKLFVLRHGKSGFLRIYLEDKGQNPIFTVVNSAFRDKAELYLPENEIEVFGKVIGIIREDLFF